VYKKNNTKIENIKEYKLDVTKKIWSMT
jgi:hypothetical protein